jgi:hypothetical protein
MKVIERTYVVGFQVQAHAADAGAELHHLLGCRHLSQRLQQLRQPLKLPWTFRRPYTRAIPSLANRLKQHRNQSMVTLPDCERVSIKRRKKRIKRTGQNPACFLDVAGRAGSRDALLDDARHLAGSCSQRISMLSGLNKGESGYGLAQTPSSPYAATGEGIHLLWRWRSL